MICICLVTGKAPVATLSIPSKSTIPEKTEAAEREEEPSDALVVPERKTWVVHIRGVDPQIFFWLILSGSYPLQTWCMSLSNCYQGSNRCYFDKKWQKKFINKNALLWGDMGWKMKNVNIFEGVFEDEWGKGGGGKGGCWYPNARYVRSDDVGSQILRGEIFFTVWRKPEEEWFLPFESFSKLKTAFQS